MIKTFNFYITFTSIFKSNLQDDTILQRKGGGQPGQLHEKSSIKKVNNFVEKRQKPQKKV